MPGLVLGTEKQQQTRETRVFVLLELLFSPRHVKGPCSQHGSYQNRAESTESPICSLPLTRHSLLIIYIPTRVMYHWFFTIDEPTLICHHHPESTVYIRIHSRFCTFYEFGQMCNDMYPPYCGTIQSCFSALRILCAPPIHPHPHPWQRVIFLLSP